MGKVDYTGDHLARIHGMPYDVRLSMTLTPDSNIINSPVLCLQDACSMGSSSSMFAGTCLDYSTSCPSSSSSSSSSSPVHSPFIFASSSYISSSSSSSSSSPTGGSGLTLIFGSSPFESSSSAYFFNW